MSHFGAEFLCNPSIGLTAARRQQCCDNEEKDDRALAPLNLMREDIEAARETVTAALAACA